MLFDRDLKSKRDYYASFDHIARISREEGREEGVEVGELKTAKKFIDNGISLAAAAKITGIPKEKLEAL